MKKRILFLAVSLLVLSFAGAASANKDRVRDIEDIHFLTADEVTALYSGHTEYGKNLHWNKSFEIIYNPDGTYEGVIPHGGSEHGGKLIRGLWEVREDGSKCNRSEKENKPFCVKIYKEDDHYISVRGRDKVHEMRFK